MNRFLLLLLLLATPARADDSITALTWNSAKGTFQALTRALGWKDIPDAEKTTLSLTCSAGCSSGSMTAQFTRVLDQVTMCLKFSLVTSGGATTVIGTIPTQFRPSAVRALPIHFALASTFATRLVVVDTSGPLHLFDVTYSSFSSGNTIQTNAGTEYTCASYNL